MPSNIFLYQLPKKEFVADPDVFLIEDQDGSKTSTISALRTYFFQNYVIPSLSATTFHAASANINTINVTNYELSGFTVYGPLGVNTPLNPQSPVVMYLSATNALVIPVGNTAQRNLVGNIPGALRYNSEIYAFEGNTGSEWVSLGETINNRFVDIGVGNVEAGQTIPKGTSLQELVDLIFTKTYFPTKEDPFATTSFNLASIVEAGTTGLTITIAVDDGRILGNNLPNGVWSPSTVQSNSYAGAVNNYTIFNVNNGVTNSRSFPSQQIVDGTNTFSSTVGLDQGPVPLDSKGGNYSVGLPRYSAGTISTSNSIIGARKVWYGVNLPTNATESTVRAYNTFKWSTNSTASIDTIQIDIQTGNTSVFFAVPADVSRTPAVIESILNVNIIDAFTTTLSTIRGAGTTPYQGSRSSYIVYRFQPATPFESPVTYTITI
jgi:hypothetical protein